MRVETYSFDSVLAGLYEAMPQGFVYDPSLIDKKLLADLFSKTFPHDALSEYAAHFLQTDFRDDAKYFRTLNHPPINGPGQKLISRYEEHGYRNINPAPMPDMSPERYEATKGLRLKTEYLLTQDQTKQAVSVIEKSELLHDTFSALQAIVVNYMQDLVKAHAAQAPLMDPGQHGEIMRYLAMVQKVSKNFAVLHDLMPTVAYSLAKDGWQPGDELTERGFARGASTSFSRSVQAFHSTEWDHAEEQARTTYCPFTKTLSKWLTSVPVQQVDGTITIADELRPGALLAFVSTRLKSLAATEPAPAPAEPVAAPV